MVQKHSLFSWPLLWRVFLGGILAGSFLLPGACSPSTPYLKMGQRLAMAGFVAHYADTTARYAMMNTLPPGQLTYRPSPIGPIFVYADPIACDCVYMGDQKAFDKLNNDAVRHEEQRSARYDEKPRKLTFYRTDLMEAENRRDTAWWDWSAWSANADPGSTQPRHVSGAYW